MLISHHPVNSINSPYYSVPIANIPDHNWYLDLGASNHISPNLNALSIDSSYSGPTKVMVGSGQNLSTQNTGSSKISTPTHEFNL